MLPIFKSEHSYSPYPPKIPCLINTHKNSFHILHTSKHITFKKKSCALVHSHSLLFICCYVPTMSHQQQGKRKETSYSLYPFFKRKRKTIKLDIKALCLWYCHCCWIWLLSYIQIKYKWGKLNPSKELKATMEKMLVMCKEKKRSRKEEKSSCITHQIALIRISIFFLFVPSSGFILPCKHKSKWTWSVRNSEENCWLSIRKMQKRRNFFWIILLLRILIHIDIDKVHGKFSIKLYILHIY